jgi:hypothetical protein
MRLQTEYMSRFKHHLMKSSNHDIQGQLLHSLTICSIHQSGLQQFEVLQGLLPMLLGLSLAFPCTPTVVIRYYMYLQICFLYCLPHAPDGHYFDPVSSMIGFPWDSGLTTSKYSQRLPVAKIHVADVYLLHSLVCLDYSTD